MKTNQREKSGSIFGKAPELGTGIAARMGKEIQYSFGIFLSQVAMAMVSEWLVVTVVG